MCRAAVMRSFILALCPSMCFALADSSLTPGANLRGGAGFGADGAAAVEALQAACGEPCARVLHSAFAALSNESADTVGCCFSSALVLAS